MSFRGKTVAVVIPSYQVTAHIEAVVNRIDSTVDAIFIVDDCCPSKSGKYVESRIDDPRVQVIYHTENQGVGGATMTGYKAAIEAGHDILVKVDGDGQMDPKLIPDLISPIADGAADYSKGNRFFSPEAVSQMPQVRLIGNAGLSFLTKMSSGYWSAFDPTNGFTAISSRVAELLPFDKISKRYFFESDILFRLRTVDAAVTDVPMMSVYEEEKSHLSVSSSLMSFLFLNCRNLGKRIAYNYFVRGFSFGSICLLTGLLALSIGIALGFSVWANSASSGVPTSTGAIIIPTLAILLGFQLVLAFAAIDVSSEPSDAIQNRINLRPKKPLIPYADKLDD